MKRPLTVAGTAAAVAIAAGTVAFAQSDTPQHFPLDCTVTGRAVTCAGTLPEAAPTSTTGAPATTATPSTASTTSPPPTSPPTTAPAAPPGGFSEDFSQPSSVDRFQFAIGFSGTDAGPASTLPADSNWMGDHDMSCGAPTTQRLVHGDTPAEMVWYCAPGGSSAAGHVMTSAAAVGYAQVDFSPKQTFANVQQVCWSQNQTDMGGRKWTQVVVLPEADYQRNGGKLTYARNDLEPDPARGFLSIGAGGLYIIDVGRLTFFQTSGPSGPTSGPNAVPKGAEIWHDTDSVVGTLSADKATRYRQCISDTPSGLHVERDVPTGHRAFDVPGVHLPQGEVRVIFQDDTYDNYKGDLGNRTGQPAPAATGGSESDVGDTDPRVTVHWDDIRVDVKP
jgi:hypothetical protein